MLFEGDTDEDGLWIDGRDDWCWATRAPPLRLRPKAAGLSVEAVETICAVQGPTSAQEFYVKFKGLAHIHCRWVPRAWRRLAHGSWCTLCHARTTASNSRM